MLYEVRAVVVSGKGKHFTSGLDCKWDYFLIRLIFIVNDAMSNILQNEEPDTARRSIRLLNIIEVFIICFGKRIIYRNSKHQSLLPKSALFLLLLQSMDIVLVDWTLYYRKKIFRWRYWFYHRLRYQTLWWVL